MSNASMPGHYHADGDPPDTVRYWDGSQWTGDPIPAPPGSISPADSAGSHAPLLEAEQFADVGIRMAALVIDFIINICVSIVLVFTLSSDNSVSIGFAASSLITLAAFGAYTFIVARWGGTPGKLMLGLRITEKDGTVPPGFEAAAKRNAPYLITIIPILGFLAIVVMLILSIVWVSSDAERRSVFDRAGNTRVVRKSRL